MRIICDSVISLKKIIIFFYINLQLESSCEGIEIVSLDVRLLLDFSLFLRRARKPFRFGLFSFLGVCGADPIIRLGEFCTKKNKNAKI